MERPFQVDEWVLLATEHDGVAAGTSVRVSRRYNSPRVIQVTRTTTGSSKGEPHIFDVPAHKLARRPGQRESVHGRLRTPRLDADKT